MHGNGPGPVDLSEDASGTPQMLNDPPQLARAITSTLNVGAKYTVNEEINEIVHESLPKAAGTP